MQESTVFAIAIRVLIALCTRTVFQPDEYFQALEPAHHAVFGYGHLTWEWMAPNPIRSIFYPALNIPIFYILKITGLAESGKLGDFLMIMCPRILHGLFASCTDIFLAQVTRRAIGPNYVSSAQLFSLTSFFHALALSRSLSNSLETSLSTMAFAYYPWDASSRLSIQVMYNRSDLRKLFVLSALGCTVRPTNAIIWVFLYGNLFWAVRNHRNVFFKMLKDLTMICIGTTASLLLMDSLYFGKFTFTPLNFIKTNASSVSLFYGSNPWHYYLTQALPILLTTALPYALHGIFATLRFNDPRDLSLRTMLRTISWTIGVYSLGGHKEWRFIHPLLPLLHVLAAKSLVDISRRKGRIDEGSRKRGVLKRTGLSQVSGGHLGFILSAIPVSVYIVVLYCSGPISAIAYFRSLPSNGLHNATIGVLMPCHSTPGYSYLHRESLTQGRMWSLGCEPPLEQQDVRSYRDQTKIFFDDPRDYLMTYFPLNVNPSFPKSPFPSSIPGMPDPVLLSTESGKIIHPWRHEWPLYLLFFGHLLGQPGVKDILESRGYEQVWSAGRVWEGEDERKGGVMVWKWKGIRGYQQIK